MSEIDWSKAPAGTTHFDPESRDLPWERREGNIWYYWDRADHCWESFSRAGDSHLEKYPQLVARPGSDPLSAWSGEGLPPVGTVCEVLWNESRMEYLRTKVFGVNEHGQPIHRFDEGPKQYQYQADVLVTDTGTPVFRLLRTPEQIAAEEREREIEALATDIMSEQHVSGRVIAERLHALGYRKVEGGAA